MVLALYTLQKVKRVRELYLAPLWLLAAVADLGGGCIPPHQPEPNDFGRKISLNFGEDLFFFFFWRPPDFGRKKRLNFRFRSKNQSQCRWRPFFFWTPPVVERKKRLNVRFRSKNQFNFGEDLFFFFLETTWFWAEKIFEFLSFVRFCA